MNFLVDKAAVSLQWIVSLRIPVSNIVITVKALGREHAS